MGKRLVLIRGLAGSGKTFLANRIADRQNGLIFSHEDHVGKINKFNWGDDESKYTHFATQMDVRTAMREEKSLVIVDACNIRPFVASPYVRMAKRYGYEYTVIMPATEWAQDPYECAKKINNRVSAAVIKDMKVVMNQIPIHVFNTLLELESPFDPVECVREAQLAMEVENPFRADEMVMDYQEWRSTDGFPPVGADDAIASIDDKLKLWRTKHWEPVNWLM